MHAAFRLDGHRIAGLTILGAALARRRATRRCRCGAVTVDSGVGVAARAGASVGAGASASAGGALPIPNLELQTSRLISLLPTHASISESPPSPFC